MRSIRMFLVLTLLCGVWILHGKTEALPPRLEIVSAIYGKGPEAVDLTDKVRKEIKAGSYLEFRNNPRFTGKNFRDRKADKNIRIVYKLGGKKEEATFKNNALVSLGRLPEKFKFGTPEWIQHFADFSGGGLVLAFSGNPARGKHLSCPKCKKEKCIAFLPFEEDHLQCAECGFTFSEKTLPTTGEDVFEGMKLEYHQFPDGTRLYWKPILRCMKAQHIYYEVLKARKKDPVIARQKLNAMLAYSKFFKKHMVRKAGKQIFRPGYPHACNYGRLCHFGDYVFPSVYCLIYRDIEGNGIRISAEERAEYRSLLEDIISEITLPFIRQWRGMANPMGQAFTDCIRVGRLFPEARIVDYYTPDKNGRPSIMSGTDLVYETVQGRNGLENLASTYWYSDGLMHEPTVAYQNMLSGGLTNALTRLEGYQPPAGYDPLQRGYQPFPDSSFLARPELVLPRKKHWEVVFPNGSAIPFGDSGPGIVTKTPQQKSDVYPGWGIGALRHPITSAAMNWGNLNDGHSHNDMLNLLYWAEGAVLLNTTAYPANERNAPIQYWRGGSGAHNTVMIDGKNHNRACGSPAAWGVTDHLQVMQGFSDRSHPGALLRRTAFLVNSRPGLPPYLVDFYEVDGGKESHDYFLLVQAEHPPQEEMNVISPKLTATGKSDLTKVFANAEKKNVYPFIRNPESGPFRGNAEVQWMIPHQNRQYHLRATLLPNPVGKNTLYTGTAPGIRYTSPKNRDPLDRTVKKVIWRREKAPSEKTMRSCFMAVFEYAREKEKLELKEIRRLNVFGSPKSHGAEISHGSGKDILLLSDANGRMSVDTSAGKIQFDGIAALLSLDRNGTLRKVTTTGLRSLTVNGKSIAGGSIFRGKLAGLPTGMAKWLQEEKPATVAVSGRIPEEAVGNILIVKHRTGTTSYKITGIKALPGNRTELKLDRSARKVIAVVSVAPNRQDITLLSGGTHEFIFPGNNFIADGQAYRIASMDKSKGNRSAGKTLGYATLKLERPLKESGKQRYPVTEFSVGDPCLIMTSKTIDLSR